MVCNKAGARELQEAEADPNGFGYVGRLLADLVESTSSPSVGNNLRIKQLTTCLLSCQNACQPR